MQHEDVVHASAGHVREAATEVSCNVTFEVRKS